MSKRCPNCDAILADDSAFCNKCGAKLADTCPKCGALLPPGSIFCNKCGHSIEGSNDNEYGSAFKQWAGSKQNSEADVSANYNQNNDIARRNRRARDESEIVLFPEDQMRIDELERMKQEALLLHVKPVAFILPFAIPGGLFVIFLSLGLGYVFTEFTRTMGTIFLIIASVFLLAVLIFIPFGLKMIEGNRECNTILRDCKIERKEIYARYKDPDYRPSPKNNDEPDIPLMY